jgi:ribosomal protein L7/L12
LTAQGNQATVDPHMTTGPSQIPSAAIAELVQGHTIEAIKIVRLEHGLGLKESKDLVDAYLKSRPDLQRRLAAAQAEARQGFVRWLILFLALAAAATYFMTQGK